MNDYGDCNNKRSKTSNDSRRKVTDHNSNNGSRMMYQMVNNKPSLEALELSTLPAG